MNVTCQLTGVTQQIPNWWRNFVTESFSDFSNMDEINDKLFPFMAQFSYMGESNSTAKRYIDFYDEEAYTAFVLRWC